MRLAPRVLRGTEAPVTRQPVAARARGSAYPHPPQRRAAPDGGGHAGGVRMTAKRASRGQGSLYWQASKSRWAASITLAGGKRRVEYGPTRLEASRKLAAMLEAF